MLSEIKGLSHETLKVEKRTLARGLEYRRSNDERAEILTAFVHFKNDFFIVWKVA
jgi:hypothetical protein